MPPYASSRCRETPTDKHEMALNLYNPNNQRHCSGVEWSGVESMWSGRLEAGVPNA